MFIAAAFRKVFFFLVLPLATCFWFVQPLGARPRVNPRHVDFEVPVKLQGRVDFWVDIFTKYGEHHEVLHHRDYPQVVFKVLDFNVDAKLLSAVRLAKYKKQEVRKNVKELNAAFKTLAAGRRATTSLERQIYGKMKYVPGGRAKYSKVLKEKLIRSQTGIREKFYTALKRSGRYMHIIEDIFVRQNGLPIELTRLPFIESSFDYKVRSSAGAAGIWQFMPRTARAYMRVDRVVDERLDVIEATRGAVKYLKYAYKQLGTWPLAITSYNHGIGGVRKRIKRIGTTNIAKIIEHPTTRVFGFASNNFYPELLAALEVYDNYLKYFPGLQVEEPVQVVEYKLPHSVSAYYVGKQLGVGADELKALNYGVSSRVWNGVYRLPKGYNLKVPRSSAKKLAALRKPEPVGPSASSVYGGIVYKVRRGDTLSRIAAKFNTTVAKIKSLNGIRGTTVYIGQKLLVKKRETKSAVSKSTTKTAARKTASASAPVSYKVRRGDSLYRIQKKFGIPVSQLKTLNNLKSSHIRVGQVLKLKDAAGASGSGKSAASGKVYKVRRGDSLWSISKKFGCSISALKKTNRLKSNSLKIGQKLTIP